MAAKKWLLTDVSTPNADFRGGQPNLGFHVRDLRGGLREGVRQVDITCGSLRFSLLPTRGLSIWKAQWEDLEFGWQSPVRGPVHPSYVSVYDPSGLGWLDGFDEMLARCGLFSNGAPEFDEHGRLLHPLHGRIANIPAEQVEIAVDEAQGTIDARGSVIEAGFHRQFLQLTTHYHCKLGSSTLEIHDSITNLSSRDVSAQLLYHFNFGWPLLDAGSQIYCPASELAPRDIEAANAIESWNVTSAPDPQSMEHVFFMKLLADDQNQSAVMFHNSQGDAGARLMFNVQQLPCFSLWKNMMGVADGYVIGLEPATNYPNIKSFEERRGRVANLKHRESHEVGIKLELLRGSKAVQSAVSQVKKLQSRELDRHEWPTDEYSLIAEVRPENA